MADALLSPAVGGTMLAVSGGLIAYSTRELRKNFDESRIPLMGVAGAFVFAMQMINFAIPGTGSSGHIAGSVLLAALLGSAPAFLVMASVLLIQALFFADGGLLAWGANVFNLGFFGCFLAYPYVFRPIAGAFSHEKNENGVRPWRLSLAAVAACTVAMVLGAFCVTLETLASGITELPFAQFISMMIPIHIAIGFVEGLATLAVLQFVRKNLPDFQTSRLEKRFSIANLCWVFALAAAVIGGGVSLLASGDPDGLEWSMEKVAGTAELESSGVLYDSLAQTVEKTAFLPDYAFPGSESWLGTTISGVVGVLICIVAMILFAKVATCRRQKPAEM
ncbi:MAG: energy-coupling factor ABC transporter permease [Planctomycetia bacterium]|nr:energy-coupling factor ABC transporter permease [Planctomycetia bacterium]